MATFVGPQALSAGVSGSERQMGTGELAQSNVHSRYYEQCRAGRLYHAISTATGIVIPVIGTAVGFALYNPVGTGVNLAIISVRLGMVSSTLILGTTIHGVNTNLSAAATTGTALTSVPGLAGGGTTALGKPLYTATLPANQTPARVFHYKQPTIATGNSFVLEDLVDGQICLAPGATWSLYGIGDDTSDLWQVSVTWEEIPTY